MNVLLSLLSNLMRLLPWSALPSLGCWLGDLAYKHQPQKRSTLLHHFKMAQFEGDHEQLCRKVFQNYAQYYLEVLKPSSPAWIKERLEIRGKKHFDEALSKGKGVIVVTAHLGNWDLAGSGLSLLNPNVAAVVEVLKSPGAFKWFKHSREKLGMTVIGLGKSAGKRCLQHLKKGEVLAIVGDRDLAGNGLMLSFMGQVASIPKGPAQLALRSGAAIVPAYFVRSGKLSFVGEFLPPLKVKTGKDFDNDVHAITHELARNLEQMIRMHPDQWCMLQPITHG